MPSQKPRIYLDDDTKDELYAEQRRGETYSDTVARLIEANRENES